MEAKLNIFSTGDDRMAKKLQLTDLQTNSFIPIPKTFFLSMKHLPPRDIKVFLYLLYKNLDLQKPEVEMDFRTLSQETMLKKKEVRKAVNHLHNKDLLVLKAKDGRVLETVKEREEAKKEDISILGTVIPYISRERRKNEG